MDYILLAVITGIVLLIAALSIKIVNQLRGVLYSDWEGL